MTRAERAGIAHAGIAQRCRIEPYWVKAATLRAAPGHVGEGCADSSSDHQHRSPAASCLCRGRSGSGMGARQTSQAVGGRGGA